MRRILGLNAVHESASVGRERAGADSECFPAVERFPAVDMHQLVEMQGQWMSGGWLSAKHVSFQVSAHPHLSHSSHPIACHAAFQVADRITK